MDTNRQTDENGKPVVPILSDDPYSCVKGEVREQVSLFRDGESVAELGEPMLWVREGENIGLEFLPCGSGDRVFHKGKVWEHFYMYTTVFIDLGVRFPFSEFENGVLSQLKCAPSQIHLNAWAFIRGFDVLMEYLGQKPLFEMYVIDFLDQYVCTREPLSLNRMVKWEKEKDSVSEYLDVSTGGLKIFFKWKSEKELSTSNAVKTEQGVVVNQPSERKKTINIKRKRQEEVMVQSKGKVVNLTESRCCGKEISLEEVKRFAENQRKLHGYVGEEDLTSVWSEHYPLSVVAEEHFQSKTDFDLIKSVDDIARAQFMQVYAARLLCIGRYEELKARKDAKQKKEESAEL
ncbi:hypothetical protein PIB30_083141 [Stylosanthes scabra]|uniref:Uncharacterized protein n=1 Tax=Stylosanthes scabra TaxID=79078 RepID=A0ABU6SSH5_9FABA|nr:hypothetical protein [Stylosanthes scabra]